MRCLEVGTVGGGTVLPAQRAALEVSVRDERVGRMEWLEMLDCAGPAEHPGDNARRLAEIICATVLAGELSLLAAQCSDDLVSSHLRLNR
jgi:hydroxymethylglutaryl-CoA reductase (NADPH)